MRPDFIDQARRDAAIGQIVRAAGPFGVEFLEALGERLEAEAGRRTDLVPNLKFSPDGLSRSPGATVQGCSGEESISGGTCEIVRSGAFAKQGCRRGGYGKAG